MPAKLSYVDMDDTLCDYSGAFARAKAQQPAIAYPQSQYGFFRNLDPLPGALASIQYFEGHPDLEVYILTAPSIYNPLCYTEKRIWVEQYLGMEMVKRLIISPNKGLNKGDYLIDDHTSGRGQEIFSGQLIQFGSHEFPDWKTIRSYFAENYHNKQAYVQK